MAARRVVALGPGAPDAAPALALEELVGAGAADLRVDGPLRDLLAERGGLDRVLEVADVVPDQDVEPAAGVPEDR